MTVVLAPGAVALDQLEAIWRESLPVVLEPGARDRAAAAAGLVERAAGGEEAIYGVNTGFGKLASIRIRPEDTARLQRNLILSHCCGVGEPLDIATTRLMMALKLVSVGRGASGLRPLGKPRSVQLRRSARAQPGDQQPRAPQRRQVRQG